MMINECGEVGGVKIGREKRSFRRKAIPVPLYPPQISHRLTWYRTLAVAMGLFIIYHDVARDVDLHVMTTFYELCGSSPFSIQ
jgi:hypothetical protein